MDAESFTDKLLIVMSLRVQELGSKMTRLTVEVARSDLEIDRPELRATLQLAVPNDIFDQLIATLQQEETSRRE